MLVARAGSRVGEAEGQNAAAQARAISMRVTPGAATVAEAARLPGGNGTTSSPSPGFQRTGVLGKRVKSFLPRSLAPRLNSARAPAASGCASDPTAQNVARTPRSPPPTAGAA